MPSPVRMGKVSMFWNNVSESRKTVRKMTYGSLGSSTLGPRCRVGRLKGEDNHLLQGIASEESLALDEESLEALDGGGSSEKITKESCLVVAGRWHNSSRC